mmetsp:Transcript_95360/g.164518  ORF Transcript_95360/g.164518 Transcript_95360/m.164518 type:complete len:87 (+) Transcript_95360:5532-5792(+)
MMEHITTLQVIAVQLLHWLQVLQSGCSLPMPALPRCHCLHGHPGKVQYALALPAYAPGTPRDWYQPFPFPDAGKIGNRSDLGASVI